LSSARVKRKRWRSEWNENKSLRYTLALDYLRFWKGQGWGWAIEAFEAWRQNPDMIPTKRKYKKVTGNRHAVKCLDGWFREPKYPVGSMVQYRRTPWSKEYSAGIVLKTNAAVPTHGNPGNKKYMILPVGQPIADICDECVLKPMGA